MKRYVEGFSLKLSMRTDLHLARKAWHMMMGLVMVGIYLAGLPARMGILILGAVLVFDLLMEHQRLRNPALNEKVVRFWGPIMRHSEMDRMSGMPYYLASAILAIAIFPKPIAVLSILYLAIGDPLASVFGILYGKNSKLRLPNGKSLVGTLAGVVVCMGVTYLFGRVMGIESAHLLTLTFLGGLAGGAAELLPLEVDDNFSIPIVSGFVLWLAFIVLGI